LEAHASEVRFLNETLPQPTEERKREFGALIDQIISKFQSSAQVHGAVFSYEINWNSSGIGAFTQRLNNGTVWQISFYDGILRLPFATNDVITLIACHEIGHHIGGFPFKENGWAAAEGQADYFSTHACAPKLWIDQKEKNAAFRTKVSSQLAVKCNESFSEEWRRDICYRSAVAMESMVLYEGYGTKKPPALALKEKTTVPTTLLMHPSPQCRIDTQMAAIFCPLAFDFAYIPGHFSRGENTRTAELDSQRFICSNKSGRAVAARPRCWFAPLEEENE
jgi:hypothetical protein